MDFAIILPTMVRINKICLSSLPHLTSKIVLAYLSQAAVLYLQQLSYLIVAFCTKESGNSYLLFSTGQHNLLLIMLLLDMI